MLKRAFERLSMRRALLIGFGLTFAIWASTAYYYSRGIADVERRASAINSRYMQAQEVLAGIRAEVLLGSIIIRDALLDPNPATDDDYRRQLLDTYRAIDRGLAQYGPILGSQGEHERFAHLRREIDDFQKTMLRVLESDDRDAPALLRTLVVPKRQNVIDLSTQVQALNRSVFVEQQAAVAAVYGLRQRRTWQSLRLALAASFAIGLLATLHAGRLERRVAEQRARELANVRELQELSSRLITAQEDERRIIARELHDEVGQVLTAIKVQLAVAQRAIEAGSADTDVLEDARAVTDGALQTVRDLSHLLHPALLDDLGLPDAITWYACEFRRRHGIRVDVTIDGPHGRLAPEVESTAYRIVQEALTNVAKHAAAASCCLRVCCVGGSLSISVEDDGAGFDPAVRSNQPHGLGLIGIRERVARLGGTMRVESAAGAGTRLLVEFAVRGRAPAEEPPAAEPVAIARRA